MKVLVLSDKAGKIESVVLPHPEFPGELHMEVEGGPAARALDVDEREIPREDLLGENGDEAEARALQKLRELL
jgi:hypothetical protein